MPHPETHLFEVSLTIHHWQDDTLDLKMPVWTPGSYLVREYARHLLNFRAIRVFNGPGETEARETLTWQKQAKNHWHVEPCTGSSCNGEKPLSESYIQVDYQIYANELTVRTNHLDLTHGFFNGAALFLYSLDHTHNPFTIKIVPPGPDWQIATTLPAVADAVHTFQAQNWDILVDSPFEIGIHQRYAFTVLDLPHRFVVWGQGNIPMEQVLADTEKVIATEAELFGGLPYEEYLFILHLQSQGFGGLEHRQASVLIYDRFGFREPDAYQRFMQLVAHEFFHLWNVKRIRPKALEVFDYEQENYTPSLWFSEGTTSYYDLLIPLRAGVYRVQDFLRHLSRDISRYLQTPGRRVQPLQESSFDAWIKLYRPDANSSNTQMSYYLKGALVSLLLDLKIRLNTHHQRSLDDVMRQMWHQFGRSETGFTPAELQDVFAAIANQDLTDFWQRYLDGLDELPLAETIAPFGLELHAEASSIPYLGLTTATEQGRTLLKTVMSHSPAQRAGLDAGDELLALNGVRVTADSLDHRLQDFQAGDRVEFTVFHRDELRTVLVQLAEPQPKSYTLSPVPQPTPEQRANLISWLGSWPSEP